MKFRISFKNKDLDIDGAFAICISREDLEDLKREIANLKTEEFIYGWKMIDNILPVKKGDEFQIIQRHLPKNYNE